MKKLLFICLLLVGCNKSEHELNTTFTIDPSLQKPDLSILKNDTISVLLCSQSSWEGTKKINSLLQRENRSFYSATAIQSGNQLNLTISDCSKIYYEEVNILIGDSTFISTHEIHDDLGGATFIPIYQKLIINKYPVQAGDTIIGDLEFRGVTLDQGQMVTRAISGRFSAIATSKE